MQPLYFLVLAEDPHLSLAPGDVLAVDIRRSRMWTATRILPPNYGYLAGLHAEGRLEWITPSRVAERVREVPLFPVRVVA